MNLAEKASVCWLPNAHAAVGCEVWRYFLSAAFDRTRGNSRQATGYRLTALIFLLYTHTAQLVLVSTLHLQSYQDPNGKKQDQPSGQGIDFFL